MIKRYYLSILSGNEKGIISEFFRFFLLPFAFLYFIVLLTRSALYKYGIVKRHRLPVTVISIGNITTGGTGKTPFVEYVARYLSSKKKRMAILSRGYGGHTVVEPENTQSSEDNTGEARSGVNDECLVLGENLNNVPILLGSDRVRNGHKAIRDYGVAFLILDDGFQHLRLKRDLDVVVIDALNPFAGECLIPRGALREPLKSLERADLFLLSHCNQIQEEGLRTIYTKLKNFNSIAPICESNHQPVHVENLADNRRVEASWLRKKRVYGLCAVGNPQSFSNTLRELGAEVIQFRTFQDHHAYTQAELDDIISEAKSLSVDAIVVTQKDAVKIRNKSIHDVSIMSLAIEIRITKGAKHLEAALSNLLDFNEKFGTE
ncbi:MAG: tetraacyldisaccharide 4'-kinase [Candidatus Scalindua sp. AMX11]|nr:MAG: tetraacyldisaccharide 4'-kinase [Candidatus Scalindua sp.]NOG83043.1 tetraacyldisaccharide 4'-kinase [Planctomycetota bacterium]RZV79557.1 MAG: tetraacyldisaccharide 4'-kinase [Candidatus Scalindua sp. SCAELEC01]TDE65196.1 MAG: tetraacyldisaccharide 4'-kinase [Candidatus Scalindua sp. AMX11]GJQ58567.1 MAG: tetraacyldisaccharide 4'-kinase [Candidatus Scalindua sp.]